MSVHWNALIRHIPCLSSMDILDLGSGKGNFLVEAASNGARAKGVECSAAYIEETYRRAAAAGVTVSVAQGFAESIPYPDRSFDFVNMTEVIEHVQDPLAMLREVRRVLRPGGVAYLSVPNRFGLKDPHFRLYFVNWLPRAFAPAFISLFGKHKDYSDASAGLQDLTKMHYYTFGEIREILNKIGFSVEDIRVKRIAHEYRNPLRAIAMLAYLFARFAYFDTAHLLIRKENYPERTEAGQG